MLSPSAGYDERRAFILAHKDDTALPDWANDELLDVLAKYPKLFSPLDDEPARIPCTMEMKPGTRPSRARVRRIHPAIYDAFKAELDMMVKAGILVPAPAHVPWASAIVVVPKRATAVGKHAGVRICGDFTTRNESAVVPKYEHPVVEHILNDLGAFSYASSLDLTMGYSQVVIPSNMRESTTIVTPEGRFMYKRLPQGLAESAAIFSSGIADILQHLINVGTVLQYVDDIAIVTRTGKAGDPATIRRHINDIDKTLSALAAANVRVNLLKSSFLSTSISYLGCIVSNGKRSIDPARLQGLNNLDAPRNLHEAEAYGGLANYHSNFVKDLAITLSPLNDYIANERRERKLNKRHSTAPSEAVIDAYNKSKQAILHATALHQPRPDRPFVIQSDASDLGMGTCVLQANDAGVLCPVAYASQKWTPTQTRYSVTDREMMGVALAFRRWPHLLRHAPDILVQSDHQNLASWTDSVSPRVSRLALFLSRFRIRFAWLKGTENTLADVLSRLRPDPNETTGTFSSLIVTPDSSHNSASSSMYGPQFDEAVHLTDDEVASSILAARDLSIGLAVCCTHDEPACFITGLNSDDLDPVDSAPPSAALDASLIRRIAQAQLDAPTERKRLSDARLIHVKSRLTINVDTFTDNEAVWIPSTAKDIINELLSMAHDNCGHSGPAKTLHRLREANVQWINMDSTVRSYISSCAPCTLSASKPTKFKHGRIGSYLDAASAPGHLLVADYAGPFPIGDAVDDEGQPIKARYTLTFVDWYSRHAKIYATEKADAATTVDCLHRYCENFGRPLRFKTDRGSHFVNETVKDYLASKNIIADFSLAYHPESQGVVERLHSPLVRAMRAYTGYNNAAWAREISRIQWSINTSYNSSIGTSPYTIFFGRKPNTELSNALGSPVASYDTYEERLAEADHWIQYVRQFLEHAHTRNQKDHDSSFSKTTFNAGDFVTIWQPKGNNSNKLSRSLRIGKVVKRDAENDQVYHVINTLSTADSNDKLQSPSQFHVDRLRLIPEQRPLDLPDLQDEHAELLRRGLGTVGSIDKHRLHSTGTYFEFLVTWLHVPLSDTNPQWAPGHSLSRCSKLALYCDALPVGINKIDLATASSSRVKAVLDAEPITRIRLPSSFALKMASATAAPASSSSASAAATASPARVPTLSSSAGGGGRSSPSPSRLPAPSAAPTASATSPSAPAKAAAPRSTSTASATTRGRQPAPSPPVPPGTVRRSARISSSPS